MVDELNCSSNTFRYKDPTLVNQNFSWQSILQRLCADEAVILLLVVASEGSAPGKPGFVMAVSKEKALQGSIGGGAVEYELVEHAHKLLHSGINPDIDSNIDSDIDIADTPYPLRPELLYRSHNGSGAVCMRCRTHLGWFFSNAKGSQTGNDYFYALIARQIL
ncbi:MAG: hypothetical protein D3910_04585 [Candidatus Electrothrix sp. ATG2]|nr:hypothetical protein [Candidatus Electrothrix sp. ATG2]